MSTINEKFENETVLGDLVIGDDITVGGDMTITGVTGILKATAGAVSAATPDTDFLTPTGSAAGLTGLTSGQVTGALGYTPQSSAGSFNLGTTSVALNRASGAMALTGITSIDGNAATVSTNANLTGPITSTGNATSVASQTGTGSKFVMDTSPTLITPNIGDATATQVAIGALSYTPSAGTTKEWYADTQNNFINMVVQNKSNGASASSDLVCTTNQGNDTSQYIDMGVNCSGWSSTSYGAAKDGYLYVDGGASGVGNLLIASAQANTKIKFQAGTLLNASTGILELNSTDAAVGGYLKRSTSATVTAGTNAQGQGALTNDYNVITTASNNPSGVTLPTAALGREIWVINLGANPVNIYPASSGVIDARSANAAIQCPIYGQVRFLGVSGTAWMSSLSATIDRKWHGQIASTSGTSTISPGTGAPSSSAGTQIMSQAVTPNDINSHYAIDIALTVGTNSYDDCITIALFRDTTFLAAAIEQAATITALVTNNRQTQSMNIRFTDAPNTLSQVTYSLRIGITGGTWYVNRRSGENTYGGTQGGWLIEEHIV